MLLHKQMKFVIGILLSIAAVILWVWYKWYTGRQMEDSLITFRYVENILNGHGMVFNVGERVLGTTTPLFTLLVASISFFFGADCIIQVADAISVLSSLGTALILYYSLRSRSDLIAAIAAVTFAVNPITIWLSGGGMETAFVIFLMAACWFAAVEGKYYQSGALAGALALTRPDSLAWSGLVFVLIVWTIYRQKRSFAATSSWLSLAFFVVLPWVIFAWLYFGSPIPNTIAAKLTIDAAKREFSIFAIGEVLQLAGVTNGSWSLLSLAQAALFIAGCWGLALKRQLHFAIFPVYAILFSGVLYFGNAPFADWYWAPCKWATLVTCVVGTCLLIQSVARQWNLERLHIPTQLAFGAVICGYSALHLSSSIPQDKAYQQIEVSTRQAVGEWLKQNTPESAIILTEPLGYIGYYSDRPILDMAGLVSPQIVEIAKHSPNNAETFKRTVNRHSPNYIVLRTYEVRDNHHFHGGPLFNSSVDSAWFRSRYQLRKSFVPAAVWGETRAFSVFEHLPKVKG
jgi:hypothetical protein